MWVSSFFGHIWKRIQQFFLEYILVQTNMVLTFIVIMFIYRYNNRSSITFQMEAVLIHLMHVIWKYNLVDPWWQRAKYKDARNIQHDVGSQLECIIRNFALFLFTEVLWDKLCKSSEIPSSKEIYRGDILLFIIIVMLFVIVFGILSMCLWIQKKKMVVVHLNFTSFSWIEWNLFWNK